MVRIRIVLCWRIADRCGCRRDNGAQEHQQRIAVMLADPPDACLVDQPQRARILRRRQSGVALRNNSATSMKFSAQIEGGPFVLLDDAFDGRPVTQYQSNPNIVQYETRQLCS